jgi:hypothetical protein
VAKAALIGVLGLSYSSFLKCHPENLLKLFNTVNRGVVENPKPQYPASSWMSVMEIAEMRGRGFYTHFGTPRLILESSAAVVNLPITNPSYGSYSIPYDLSVHYEDEVREVVENVLKEVERRPVIASISAIDRFLHYRPDIRCEIYKAVDVGIGEILEALKDFVLFSPYGEPMGEEGFHESHGVYLSTMPRPRERDTVKLRDLGLLFLSMLHSR